MCVDIIVHLMHKTKAGIRMKESSPHAITGSNSMHIHVDHIQIFKSRSAETEVENSSRLRLSAHQRGKEVSASSSG